MPRLGSLLIGPVALSLAALAPPGAAVAQQAAAQQATSQQAASQQAVATEHYAHHPLHVRPNASSSPTGLSPETIKSVYNFPTGPTAGAGTTIAIVDAFDDPKAEADLDVFSSQYGLPACTTANGCFSKVNQTGGTRYPRTNSGWALEISLDVQWAHAIAPGAKILLVESRTNSFTNLLAAEDYAKTHAQYVSNSWGASEFSGESSYDPHFAQPGVSFFASSGDSGTPASYPSASPNLISVGGTTLTSIGGTSASAPMWAARSAVAGAVVDSAYVYGNNIAYRDITSGNNGASCLVGYDLVTGRGSWTG